MKPLVSVLIPSYNSAVWIGEAITSALNQLYRPLEVIVIDDGSTDQSRLIIQRFGSSITSLFTENRGGNATRNHLLELSQGEWLQYLDSDDYLLPDKISTQMEFIAQHPCTDIVYGPSIMQHHDDGEQFRQKVQSIPEPHDPWVLLARWYLPQTGSPLWRKQAILDAGGWKVDQPCCQEHELYFRLLQRRKRFRYCDHAASVYRQWSETTVCNKNKSQTYHRRLEILEELEKHLLITRQLNEFRLNQINQSRFECARIIWLTEPNWAHELIEQIHQSQPKFIPGGACAPDIYRLTYLLMGFEMSEKLAAMKRQLITT